MKVKITLEGEPNSGKKSLLSALTHMLDKGVAPYEIDAHTNEAIVLSVDTSAGLQWLRNLTGDRPEVQNRDAKAVTQPWTHRLTFMQQTVLLTAIRGPDGMPKYGPSKMLLRWYRRCTLLSSLDGGVVLADPFDPNGGSFMGPSISVRVADADYDWQWYLDYIVSQYLRELDALPHHFQLHLLHAAEIVGYKHPEPEIRAWWHRTYLRLVHDMHLWPETEEQMDRRLGDSRDQWLERNDVATID